jgi:hypothetical protein
MKKEEIEYQLNLERRLRALWSCEDEGWRWGTPWRWETRRDDGDEPND